VSIDMKRVEDAVADYFSRVQLALPKHARGRCKEAVEDLRALVLEKLGTGAAEPSNVAAVLDELGAPETLAASLAESIGTRNPSPLSGSLLGVPYELRLPTAERAALRFWNPEEPRLFVPRLFGVGWTLNFASLAVRLGFIRPDDEEIPFALVPESRLAAALILPAALAAAMACLAAVFPMDRSGTNWEEPIMPIVMTALGLVLAVWTWIRRRPPLLRVAAGALGTALASVSIGAYGYYSASGSAARGVAFLVAGIAAALLLPFALFVIMSRIGRAAEQKRDMGDATGKGGSR
jgi:hypothetical protein